MIEAGRRLQGVSSAEPEDFLRLLADVDHSQPAAPAVDLLIRTGGERRLSDFLLWECAYAELCFLDCMWPEFDETAFAAALEDYAHRQRRFGRVTPAAPARPAVRPVAEPSTPGQGS